MLCPPRPSPAGAFRRPPLFPGRLPLRARGRRTRAEPRGFEPRRAQKRRKVRKRLKLPRVQPSLPCLKVLPPLSPEGEERFLLLVQKHFWQVLPPYAFTLPYKRAFSPTPSPRLNCTRLNLTRV